MTTRKKLLFGVPALLLLATPAAAQDEAPQVVATIKPVHSLVASVMEGVGTPHLLVQGGGSPHAYALKPSDARLLEDAELVFWVGEDLESFLEKPLETLAGDATAIALSEAPGLQLQNVRGDAAWEAHDHAGLDQDKDEHEHEHEGDDHDDAGGEHERAGHEHGHAEDAAHAEGHGHGEGHELHVWLDPVNAKAMVDEIARALAEADPQNAERYRANQQTVMARLDALTARMEETLAPVRDRPFVVFHDAYRYLEERFGLNAVGSITVSPEAAPSAQRVREIRQRIAALDAACVFSEPQFEPRLLPVVTEGTQARTGVLDPLGADIPDGPDLYFTMMERNAEALASCLSGEG
jgi:zinc transport system substrate-binding protein